MSLRWGPVLGVVAHTAHRPPPGQAAPQLWGGMNSSQEASCWAPAASSFVSWQEGLGAAPAHLGAAPLAAPPP